MSFAACRTSTVTAASLRETEGAESLPEHGRIKRPPFPRPVHRQYHALQSRHVGFEGRLECAFSAARRDHRRSLHWWVYQAIGKGVRYAARVPEGLARRDGAVRTDPPSSPEAGAGGRDVTFPQCRVSGCGLAGPRSDCPQVRAGPTTWKRVGIEALLLHLVCRILRRTD